MLTPDGYTGSAAIADPAAQPIHDKRQRGVATLPAASCVPIEAERDNSMTMWHFLGDDDDRDADHYDDPDDDRDDDDSYDDDQYDAPDPDDRDDDGLYDDDWDNAPDDDDLYDDN